ncbi:cadmium resistance transporter [Allokutzneria oryzae]|uniref:Cadmium resistance transporter n=1 Tax=Allokutzneria oryzae TaxID=1378989 RepID=A0ABV6A1A5_9PSEU
MDLGLLGQAAGMFTVTNIDDLLLLALFFARPGAVHSRVVMGQYLGFSAILALSVVGALGATLLPEPARPYLGLLPLLLGLRAAWAAWSDSPEEGSAAPPAPGVLAVAAVTLANGGDNIGVYVPVFTASGLGALLVYVAVFLALVGVWCVVGRYLAGRQAVARVLSRWGHVLLPVVLVGIGVLILFGG